MTEAQAGSFNYIISFMAWGIAAGTIVLIKAMQKQRLDLALAAFFTCVVAGALGTIVLAIPAAGLWWWGISRLPDKPR